MDLILTLFGSGDGDLNVWQMALRAVVVMVFLLVLIRVGNKRLLGSMSAFDFVIAIVIGSIASRAITGNAAFWPSLAASVVLVALHRLIGTLAVGSDTFARWVKGEARVLARDGVLDEKEMRRAAIGRHDIERALRSQASGRDLEDVSLVCLERDGSISVVCRPEE